MGVAIATPDLESAPRRPGRLRTNLLPYALIGPSVVVIGGILAFPLGMLVWLSLQHYGLRELIAHQGEWVGAGNYQAILVDPLFRQVIVRERVAQTGVSESAFNDAIGAVMTFGVLAVAMGGESSVASSLLEMFKQSIIGIVAGLALGYLAALLIAHERWAFLAEYAPVVNAHIDSAELSLSIAGRYIVYARRRSCLRGRSWVSCATIPIRRRSFLGTLGASLWASC